MSVIKLAGVESITTSADYMTRLNYGFTATKIRRVMVAHGYYLSTFHFDLPKPQASLVMRPPVLSAGEACELPSLCSRMRSVMYALANLTFNLQNSIVGAVNRINDLIPEMETRSKGRLKTRGLVDAVGVGLHVLFGVSTDADVADLRQVISKIKNLAKAEAEDSFRTRHALASFTTLENQRFDNLRDLLTVEHKTLTETYAEVRRLSDSTSMDSNAQAFIAKELAEFIQLQNSLQLLERGLQDLVHGMISPSLVNADLLSQVMQNASRVLARHSYVLCYKTPQQVYASKTFDYARHENTIIIRLRLPYSEYVPMNVYRTSVLPLPVVGKQGFVTQLNNIPRYLITYLARDIIGELLEPPQSQPVFDDFMIKWHSQEESPCLFALLRNDPVSVAESCEFSTFRQVIQPSLVRLTKGVYVLANYSNITVNCPEGRLSNLTTSTCNPCLVAVECGCTLQANSRIIASELQGCSPSDVQDTKLQFGVNAILLQTFYDLGNFTVTGKDLFDTHQDFDPIHWPIFSDNVSRLLAHDAQISYSLKQVASSLQNNSPILHSAAEGLLLDYMENLSFKQSFFHVDWWSCTTYLLLLLCAGVVILGCFAYRTHRKLTFVYQAAVLKSALLPRAVAVKLRGLEELEVTTSAGVDTLANLIQIFSEIRHIDFALAVCMVVIFLCLMGLVIIIKRRFGRQSFLYLDVENGTRLEQIKVLKFPDASRAFSVDLPDERTKLKLKTCCGWGILRIISEPWKIVHAFSGKEIGMPKRILVPPRKARNLRKIL